MIDPSSSATPVQAAVTVPLEQDQAFSLFVNDMNSWWPEEVHVLPSPTCEIVVEPRVGGRWLERTPEGQELDWGEVLVYEQPALLVLSWQLSPRPYDPQLDDHPTVDYDPELLTELELRVVPVDGGTRVSLEHRLLENLGDSLAADLIRELLAGNAVGWPHELDCYASVAARQAPDAGASR